MKNNNQDKARDPEPKAITNDNISKGFDRVERVVMEHKSMGINIKPPILSERALRRRRERNEAKLRRRAEKRAAHKKK